MVFLDKNYQAGGLETYFLTLLKHCWKTEVYQVIRPNHKYSLPKIRKFIVCLEPTFTDKYDYKYRLAILVKFTHCIILCTFNFYSLATFLQLLIEK